MIHPEDIAKLPPRLALFLQLRFAPATMDSACRNAAAVAPTAVLDFGEASSLADGNPLTNRDVKIAIDIYGNLT